MKAALPLSLSLLAALAACVAPTSLRTVDARDAESIEMQVDDRGHTVEVEYHVPPEAVPAGVHEAMDALHPGGQAIAAEKEYVRGRLYWELTKRIDGKDVEAMFLPDGTLHSEEVEVDEEDVPESVRGAVAVRQPGEVTSWEEIRDGSRTLVEYHAKVTASDGRKYKLMVSTGGVVTAVVREVEAEIEVPVS